MTLRSGLERRRIRRRLHNSSHRFHRPMRFRPSVGVSQAGDLTAALGTMHRFAISGHALETAIRETVRSHPSTVFDAVMSHLSTGATVGEACRFQLTDMHAKKRTTVRERDNTLALHVVSLADALGGRVSEHLESLLDIVTERDHIRRELATQSATATASVRLMTWMPLVCGAWMLMDSADIRSFLLDSVPGWTCLVLGIALNLSGRLWMQHVIVSANGDGGRGDERIGSVSVQ